VKISVVDKKRAGEARLYDQAIASVEIDDNQLGSTPAADDRCIVQPLRQRARIHFAQDVALPNGDLLYLPPADGAVEIAGNRLRLR